MSGSLQRITRNPFYVLGLTSEATRAEVEREGQKLLGMLAVGLSAARHYDTPLGRFERTETDVREAMAELRDPARRTRHALWACMPAAGDAQSDPTGPESKRASSGGDQASPAETGPARGHIGAKSGLPGWSRALEVLGWGRNQRPQPRDGDKQ